MPLALITGASAGIGQAFARVIAAAGWDVALTARRAERLESLAAELRLRHGATVLCLPADLTDPAAPEALLAQVASHGRTLDGIVNNAGYGLAGTFAETPWEQQQAYLQAMTLAPVELARKALPGMLERRFGRIVNVASLAGLAPGAPGTNAYGAVKAFLVRFSQGLHAETAAFGVHVTALCPGFTYSEFHSAAGLTLDHIPHFLWQGPDEVAKEGWEAVEAGRPLAVPGAQNKALAALAKLIPDEWAMSLVARRARRAGLV